MGLLWKEKKTLSYNRRNKILGWTGILSEKATTIFSLFSNQGSPGRVAQSVGHLTRKSWVLGSIPCLATYFRFSFRFIKKGSCQLLAKVCARSTG